MIARASILIALVALSPTADKDVWAQGPARSDAAAFQAPSATAGLFIMQGAAGAAGGFLGGLALGAAGAALIGPHGGEDPGLVGALIGGLAGFTLGTGAGVSGAARLQHEPSSFGGATMGAFLGLGLVGALSKPLNLDPDYAPLWICLFTIPPATAVILNRVMGASREVQHLTVRPLAGGRVGVGAVLGF
jgi:hypothetical protein